MGNAGKLELAIAELQRKRPFDPFRIVTSRGEKILVAEPDMIILPSGDSVHVMQRSGRLLHVPKVEIIAIEELTAVKAKD